MNATTDIFGPAISVYTRAQAIEDGVLAEVPAELAREAGFKFPVALTAGAWERCVTVPPGVEGQDETGRLWDVLWMLRNGIRRSAGGERVDFSLYVRSRQSHAELCERDRVELYALCGPGDAGEPVITVMLPGED